MSELEKPSQPEIENLALDSVRLLFRSASYDSKFLTAFLQDSNYGG